MDPSLGGPSCRGPGQRPAGKHRSEGTGGNARAGLPQEGPTGQSSTVGLWDLVIAVHAVMLWATSGGF